MKTRTVKTSELIGPALDWAVDVAQTGKANFELWAYRSLFDQRRSWTTSWHFGGPLIDKALLSVYPFFIDGNMGGWSSCDPLNLKYDENGSFIDGSDFAQDGPTALVAAMRCYVASKLGDKVEVPEELMA